MIKLTLKHTDGKEKTLLVPEQKPLKEILEGDELYSPFDIVTMNGKPLSWEDLDKSLLDLGCSRDIEMTLMIGVSAPWKSGEEDILSPCSVIYPPKTLIVGCACVVISTFTPEELKDFECYLPDALTMRDEKGEPVFAISLDEKSSGSLTKYGAVFSKRTNSEGHATITIIIDPECDDPEDAVRGALGSAIISLVSMEESLMGRLHDLNEKKTLLVEHIQKL